MRPPRRPQVDYVDPLRLPPLATVDADVFANHRDREAVIRAAIELLEHGLVSRAHALLKATELRRRDVWKGGEQNTVLQRLAKHVTEIHEYLSAKKYAAALSAINSLEEKSRRLDPEGPQWSRSREANLWELQALAGLQRWEEVLKLASSLVAEGPEVLQRAARYYRLLSFYNLGRLPLVKDALAEYRHTDASPSPQIRHASAIINPIEMIANLWDSAHQAYHAKRYEQALKQLEACLVLETSNAAVRASLLGRRGRIRYKKDEISLAEQDIDEALKAHAMCTEALKVKGALVWMKEGPGPASTWFKQAYHSARSEDADRKAVLHKLWQDALKAEAYQRQHEQSAGGGSTADGAGFAGSQAGAKENDNPNDPYHKRPRDSSSSNASTSPRKGYTGNDVYKILAVDRLADSAQIQQSFKRLSLLHHPDKGGDTEAFKRIKAAFDILMNPDKRARFDKLSADHITYRFDPFRF